MFKADFFKIIKISMLSYILPIPLMDSLLPNSVRQLLTTVTSKINPFEAIFPISHPISLNYNYLSNHSNIYNNDSTNTLLRDEELKNEELLGPDNLAKSKLLIFFSHLIQRDFNVTSSLKYYLVGELERSWKNDPKLTLRIIFYRYYSQERRSGEKELFKETFAWLSENHLEVAKKNLHLVIEWGGYETLLQFRWCPGLRKEMSELIAHQLLSDRQHLKAFESENLELTLENIPFISNIAEDLSQVEYPGMAELLTYLQIDNLSNYMILILMPLQTHLRAVDNFRTDHYWKHILTQTLRLTGYGFHSIHELPVKI